MARAAEVPYFPDDEQKGYKRGSDQLNEDKLNEDGLNQDRQNYAAATAAHPAASAPAHPTPEEPAFSRQGFERARSPQRHSDRTTTDSVYESLSAAIEACQPLLNRSSEVARSMRRRMKEVKEENPLQLIALIAGSMFAAGMVIRFWRSRS